MPFSEHSLPILQTKFCAPQLGEDLVRRDRLLTLMDGSLNVPLTLVSAPAGYGKSVLVSHWMDSQVHPVIWISLDAGDGELRQFISYLAGAIAIRFPEASEVLHELNSGSEPPPIASLVCHLLNELSNLEKPVTLVLDDYHHLAQSSDVHQLIDGLLLHPPLQAHFVLITRRDPPVLLTRLRALGQMLEIRMRDLQFTQEEVAELLESATGRTASDKSITHLQQEVEGWAVGLRLASLALRHRKNPNEFLFSLHGGIPQVQEYLLNEVLSSLSEIDREFLLKTSVLNRFCGELIEYSCDAGNVAMSEAGLAGADFIFQLKQRNLFTISLDAQGEWFRYHHLFQVLLQNELGRKVSVQEISDVHMRASVWFETNGLVEEAIEHAMKAGDATVAARIIERHCYDEIERDRVYVVERWLALIPPEITRQRIILVLAQTWLAFSHQNIERAASLVNDAELLLVDSEEHSGIAGELDFFKGSLCFWGGQLGEAIRLLERAQRRVDPHKSIIVAETDLHLTIVRYMSGQGEMAVHSLNEQIRKCGGRHLARRVGALAFLRMFSGDLPGLEVEARRMLAMGKSMRSPLVDSWSVYFQACVNLHLCSFEEAATKFQTIMNRPHITDRRAVIDAFAGFALAQQLSGNTETANSTVDQLMNYLSDSDDPANRVLAGSCQARIQLLQGKIESALGWESSFREVPGVFDLFIWLEVPAITRVRVLLASGSAESLSTARELIDSMRSTSESNHFVIQLVEITVLESLVLDKQGKREQALESLQSAIDLARPGGWVRPFLEAGLPMTLLLERLSGKGVHPEYVSQLLLTIRNIRQSSVISETTPHVLPNTFEDLTNRELDILELLAQRMQNKEIANQLFISTHTVKDHLKHIYQKLGVSTRRQAVAEAIKAGIIPPA